MSTNLMAAHSQWASRPADERFWNLDDLRAALSDVRDRSFERTQKARAVRAEAVQMPGYDSPDLCLRGSRGPISLTHWSFNQLARYADAPADYLRRLPVPLAAECLNTGLARYDGDDVQLLLHKNGEPDWTVRSLTTAYSRLWNVDVINALVPATERGWIVPPARPAVDDPRARPATTSDIVPGQDGFGLAVKPGDLIAPAGVYASDRDMFVFLVHPERIVDTSGSGGLMRGVFVWNSEVGAGAFKVQTFLLEAVCGNHIVWGASDVQILRIVHKGDNFRDIGWKLSSQLGKFAEADTSAERLMIQRSRNHVLGKDRPETVETLFNQKALGLSKTIIEAAYSVAERFEHTAQAPPTTAWGFAHGLTRFSQSTPYADERAKLDAAAGRLLALAG
jgi:hypothetical protein